MATQQPPDATKPYLFLDGQWLLIVEDDDDEKVAEKHGHHDQSTHGRRRGGGSGGGLASLSEADREGAEALQSYLKGMPEGSEERFVSDHGQAFATTAATYEGPRGTPHHCYENAARKVVFEDNPDLTYVEGFMTVHGVPLQHAWLVDRQGRVIDPTITNVGVKGYFGVPFSTDYVRETAMRTRYWGVISSRTNRTLLREGPPAGAIAKVGS